MVSTRSENNEGVTGLEGSYWESLLFSSRQSFRHGIIERILCLSHRKRQRTAFLI